MQYIKGNLSLASLEEFIQSWDMLEDFQLHGRPERHMWRFSNSEMFSSKSAYNAFSPVLFPSNRGKGSRGAGLRLSLRLSFGLLSITSLG